MTEDTVNNGISLPEAETSLPNAVDSTKESSDEDNDSVDYADDNSVDYYADDDSDSDDPRPVSKRVRRSSLQAADYIAPFADGAVGNKFVVVKGIKPGIYADL